MTELKARLAATVPSSVRFVCETLGGAGHRAFAVGGAVRDAMLGRVPGDWDVTTSALPDQVTALFRKTIPTGLEHGTVTVMAGRGGDRMPIEVTTFRGEGAYSDARRPDDVTFGVSLEEDLARRDFVVNAIAYDPISGELEDPFDGAADIDARVVRAVGDAATRFTEDGLRIMRAVRFVSVLEFTLESKTEEAIEAALPSLAKVAAERVRVELLKLLGGAGVATAIDIAYRRRVFATAVPILGEIEWATARERCLAIEGDAVLRLAALVFGRELSEVESAMRGLTCSSAERNRIVAITRHGASTGLESDTQLRGRMGKAGRVVSADLAAMWRANGNLPLAERAESILAANDPLVASELAIRGKDVMEILDIGPSREIGDTLAAALEMVHRDPSANTREALTSFIRARADAS